MEGKLNKDADSMQFEDYVSAIQYLHKHGRAEDRLLFLFQVVDTDADGAISYVELMELLTRHSKSEEKDNQSLYVRIFAPCIS